MINTAYGIVMGTAHYMSPEQARGLEVDARTESGVSVCALRNDRGPQPFTGPTALDVMSGISIANPESHQVSAGWTTRTGTDHFACDAQRTRGSLSNHPGATDRSERSQARTGKFVTAGVPFANEWPRYAETVPEKSIAVLYFENMNSESESDYFCAGMTEDIITDLSKIKELKVVSRTDVLPFRKKEVNTRQVGDALRVNYILEGSVRKAGNRIRITAQLISVRDGYHFWAERFDRLVEDIFDLQNEVSEKIVDALKISMSDSERQALAQKPTDDLRAYDFYMRGRELLYLKRTPQHRERDPDV